MTDGAASLRTALTLGLTADYLTGGFGRWGGTAGKKPGSARAEKVLDRQERGHGPRPEAFQIEGNELESESLEHARELGRHGRVEGTAEFIGSDLDADDVAMMTYAKLTKTKAAQRVFSLLHHRKSFTRNRSAIFDARRQASRSGCIPDP